MVSTPRKRAVLWTALWLFWVAVVAMASLVPGDLAPWLSSEAAQKAGHIAAYFVLGVLGVGAVARIRRDWPRPVVGSTALIAGALVGGVAELLQSSVAGRRMTLEDWLTDLLGLALAVIAARAARGGLARAWLGAG